MRVNLPERAAGLTCPSGRLGALQDLDVEAELLPARCRVEAWTPRVPGIREVFRRHTSVTPAAYARSHPRA
jgi:hypothetical protein